MPIDRDGEGPPLRRDDAKSSASRPDDLRATPFTDDVFDDDYYGRRRGRGVSFGLVAGITLGAAAVALVGWYILGASDADLLTDGVGKDGIVHADPTPYKVKPEDPGGQVENQDKLVYDRLDKSGKPASRVENLLPEPEQPKAPPVKKAEPPPKPAQPPQSTAAASDDLAKLVAKVAGEPGQPAAASSPSAPAPAASGPMTPLSPLPTTTGSPANAANAPVPPAPATVPPGPPTQLAEAAPAASAPEVSAGPGAMFLQLASARSEEAALGEWKRIQAKNGDLLTGLSPSVVLADLGDRGIYYRLRAGPVPDKAAADGLCASLADRSVGCIVVKP